MIVWIENVFEGGISLNNYKKESDISIKVNGDDQTMLKSDDSFDWILPKGVPRNENVVKMEEFQKKKGLKKFDKPTSKKIKRAELLLLLFFAIIIGGLFGVSLLNVLPEVEPSSKSVQSVSVTLDPIHVFVEQVGVFSELSGAESVSNTLDESAILQKDKYYVLSDISGNRGGFSESSYVKQLATQQLTIENIDDKTADGLVAIRNLLNSLITADDSNVAELYEEISGASNLDSNLRHSALTAYEEKDSQALLDFYITYDEFVSNYK